jgi:hypothetical protein
MRGKRTPGKTVSLFALINVLLSISVPAGASLLGAPISGTEGVILGTSLFVATSVLEMLYYLVQLRERAIREDVLWDTHATTDAMLANIRKSIRSLEVGVDARTDLFLRYFENRVHDLDADLRHTASSRELRLDSQYLDLSGPLLASFAGRETDVIRIVHLLSQNDSLFNVHEAQWFYRVFDAVAAGRVREVRRLLVFENEAEKDDSRSVRLVRFHHHAEGYHYRLIGKLFFDRLARDFRLQGEFVDFGIYGARYLYRAILYEEDDLVGFYSRDPVIMARYADFFDFCWSSPTSRLMDPDGLQPLALEDLFESS